MRTLDGARVVVTGGAGFIGSELTRQAVAAGASVTVLDSLVNGRTEHLAPVLGERCRLARADVRDADAVAGLVEGADLVYHLAALGVRHSIHSPRENHEVNAAGTLTLLAAARRAGVPRFVHVSTSEVYGNARTVPMQETHPLLPNTVYGASKLAGEAYARAYHLTYGYPTVVVRPFNSYGPRCHHEGDSGIVIPKFLLRCLAGRPLVVFGDGEQTRDFTYVTDTARGILLAGLADDAVGATLNVGSQMEITVNALARLVVEVVGRPDAAIVHEASRPGDTRRLFADIGEARRLLGFAPRVSLREGLLGLLEWYRESGLAPERLLEEEVVHNWEAVEERRG